MTTDKTKNAPSPDAPTAYDAMAGERVRALRLAQGLSRRALGRACGVSGQQIDKYELGLNRMTIERFAQIADALGTEPSRLLRDASAGRGEEQGDKNVADQGRADGARAKELASLIGAMDEATADHLLAVARAVVR